MNPIASLGISIIALTLSLVSTVITLLWKKTEMQRTWRSQLSGLISELVKADAENSEMFFVPQSSRDEKYYQKSSIMSQRINSLVRQTLYLAKQHPRLLTDVENVIIARALVVAGDRGGAREYWLKSIESAPNSYYRITNIRGYADFLFADGEYEPAREYYRKSLSILQNTTDSNKSMNGYTYIVWMVSEANNIPAPYSEASACYRNAKGLYESISSAGMKDNCLNHLEQMRMHYIGNETSAQTPVPTVPSDGVSYLISQTMLSNPSEDSSNFMSRFLEMVRRQPLDAERNAITNQENAPVRKGDG